MKNKSLPGLFSIFAFGIMLFLSVNAFAQNKETVIQGTWRLSGETPKNNSGRSMQWFIEWTFLNGTFLQAGYPPIKQEGKYRIVKQDENKLTLELFEQKGDFGTKNKQIEIVIDAENEKLKIDGKVGFSRVKNRKQED